MRRRLLNPAKSDIGVISKHILQGINKTIAAATGVNLWRSNTAMLEWFDSLDPNKNLKFVVFDIVSYYPSITKELLERALDFADHYCEISDLDRRTIFKARESLLICDGKTWTKRNSDGLFDVPMGSYDSCEVCELIGLFLLSQIAKIIPKENLGLYRDDGLCAVEGSGPQLDRLRKKLEELFKENNLSITALTNVTVTEYLDTKLDLNSRTYRPYRKPNNEIVYIHKDSNHPPSIIKSNPLNINHRLSTLSSNEAIFNEEKHDYQEALKKFGYTHELEYRKRQPEQKKKRSRRRAITWFNPPWSAACKTPVAEMFLKLVDTSFPRGHPLHKFFNRNTLKVSYRTTKNLGAYVASHNRNTLSPKVQEEASCNCKPKFKADCPLPGNCMVQDLVYEAEVTTESTQEKKVYYGQTSGNFKKRYYEHKSAMNNENSAQATALSRYVWKLKKANKNFSIKWSVVCRAPTFTSGSKKCLLCLKEKVAIATCDPNKLLNSRTELLNKCIHVRNFELRNHKKSPP